MRTSQGWMCPLGAAALAGALVLPGAFHPLNGATPVAALEQVASHSVSKHAVTLVTGDVVRLRVLPSGRMAVTFDPSADDPHEGFQRYQANGGAYLIPNDAAPYVYSGQVDRELFNLSRLVEQGYGDTRTNMLPVIVAYDLAPGVASDRDVAIPRSAPAGSKAVRALESIDGVALAVHKSKATQFWSSVTHSSMAGGPSARGVTGNRSAPDLSSGIRKVWLDSRIHAPLDDSVLQIGAPRAWAGGFDGSGTRVAVLDTGVDAAHPDLAGQVVAQRNFTSDPGPADGNGHGTHVASIVAGTGAGSEGQYRGVAPGADLLVGKVLRDSGTGFTSWAIDGMEWAAAQDVDVVSMSLAAGASDGTDPMSQAVNELTSSSDTLFVIAAGNDGPAAQTVTTPGAADAALTVGAVNDLDALAEFSGRGPRIGDNAVKPEITAPGVGIIAARASGTSLGEPVNALYTSANGTSMATPHVAGAAAILAQQHPDWGARELKAVLVSTADPTDGLSVFQQGAGRLDVARAFSQGVHLSEGVLNFGVFPWPHDAREPVTRAVSYRNTTDHSVTLDLSLTLTHTGGAAPPESMSSVSPSSLTVPSGSSGRATLTLDLTEGEVGAYGGTLVAAGRDGDLSLRTALSFTKEREMYDVSVSALGRDGQPAFGGSKVTLWNPTSDEWESKNLDDSPTTFRVPPGDYAVMAYILTIDAEGRTVLDATLAGQPELTVTKDTTLRLDAREGREVVVETRHETEHKGATLGWYRRVGQNDFTSSFSFNLYTDRIFAVPTEPVQRGEFEFYTRWDLFAPELRAQVVKPDRFDITTEYLVGAPKLDGRLRLPVAYAGRGTPEELAAAGVEGSVALMRRTDEVRDTEQVRNAAEAGAQLAMIFSDRPGKYQGFVGEVPITAVAVSQVDGERLLRQLDEGQAIVDLRGTWPSPFVYDLVLPEDQQIPEDLTYRIKTRDVATIDTTFHGSFADQEVGDVRFYFRPYDELSVGFRRDFPVPFERTGYVSANDTLWNHAVFADPPFAGELLAPLKQYQSGQRVRESWLKSPSAPGIPPGTFLPSGGGFAAYRDGNVLHFDIPEFGDADPDHFGFRESTDETAARLYRGGELLAEESTADADLEVPPAAGLYRLELDVARTASWWTTSTATRTAWTFRSQLPDDGERALLPLLGVDFNLDVDGLNRARADHPATIDFGVRHQPGLSGPPIDGAKLWVSYDDGATWQEVSKIKRRPGNAFRAWLRNPPAGETSGYVSVRVRANDVDGNAIEQTILRAYALKSHH